jgi:pimeloyl-ACP methyl ester carboxylesterase
MEPEKSPFNNILTSTDPYLLYMTSMPFRNPEALYRYAHIMSNLLTECDDAWTDGVNHPVLVYTGENDKVADKAGSIALANRLPNSTLRIDDSEDHFAQFYRQEVADMIHSYVSMHRTGAVDAQPIAEAVTA